MHQLLFPFCAANTPCSCRDYILSRSIVVMKHRLSAQAAERLLTFSLVCWWHTLEWLPSYEEEEGDEKN